MGLSLISTSQKNGCNNEVKIASGEVCVTKPFGLKHTRKAQCQAPADFNLGAERFIITLIENRSMGVGL